MPRFILLLEWLPSFIRAILRGFLRAFVRLFRVARRWQRAELRSARLGGRLCKCSDMMVFFSVSVRKNKKKKKKNHQPTEVLFISSSLGTVRYRE